MKQYIPGIAYATLIGLMGYLLAKVFPNLGDVSLAIILGIVAGNCFKGSPQLHVGIEFCEKKLLAYAVILMGFSLDIRTLQALGFSSLLFIFLIIIATIVVGRVVAKYFGLTHSLGMLLGIGNAICGSSAIAATSPLLTKNKEEVAISIGVVNLIGTFGIFVLPLLMHALRFSEHQASLLIGGSLQALGHVIAAGYTVSERVGEMSTAVKMARIFLLGPTIMLLAFVIKARGAGKSQPVLPGQGKQAGVPFYLYGFVLCAIINNFNIIPATFLLGMQKLSHALLIASMAGTGLRIKIAALLSHGPRAMGLGTVVFLFQLLMLLLLVLMTDYQLS